MAISSIELQRQNFAGQKLGPEAMRRIVPVIIGLRKQDGTPLKPPKRVEIGAISRHDCG